MRDEQSENRLDRIFKGLIFLGIFGLLDLILFGLFGYSGNFVKNFLIGIFGYVVYGYCIAATVASLFVMLGFKPKVSFKVTLNYILILFVIICIGHLVTYKDYSALSYADYVAGIFGTHDSLAGAAFAWFLYPFSKLYVFSVVVFSLLLVGLVALCIVNQLDFELGLKIRNISHRKSKVNSLNNTSNVSTVEDYGNNNSNEIQRELYNGDVNGKIFTNTRSKVSRKDSGFDITPIEELGTMNEDETDGILSGLSINPGDIDTEIKLTQERAKMFQEASPIIPIQPIENEINNEVEPEKEEDGTKDKEEEIVISDSDKGYFNTKRRESAMRGDSTPSYSKPSYINKNEERDPFEELINKAFEDFNEENKDESQLDSHKYQDESSIEYQNPIQSSFDSIVNEPINEEIEDKTEYIEHPLGTMEDFLNKNEEKKQEENKNARLKEDQKMVSNYDMGVSSLTEKDNQIKEKPEVKPEIIAKPIENKPRVIKKYRIPDYDILGDYPPKEDPTDFTEKAEDLKRTLSYLKLNVEISKIIKGPTFSRIDFKLEEGTPLNRLTPRKDDIMMGLAVTSLRLLAPIPGTSYCGVEIPSLVRNTVGLKDVITSDEYQNAIKSQTGLIFAFGKNIENRSYFYDLTKTPHLLIAGATGSGKSIAINVMLCSLLFRYSPQDLRLILFDPKQVEFEVYNKLPHLLIPHILNEPKKAVSAMKWAIDEMERRYTIMKLEGVRNVDEYNQLDVIKADISKKLPYIVIVIDEFAEVVLSDVGKEFDVCIKRLTAKARAAGLHLVLATQRPSVDIINGTIKANLPCRMALRVSSGFDSQTILGTTGAEDLLGKGDMLFQCSDSALLERVQGAFISTEEVKDVVNLVVDNNSDAYFDESAEQAIMTEPKSEDDEESQEQRVRPSIFPDPLCLPALKLCVEQNQVSTSFLQRKFGIGFPKAGKITDWMMDMGYVKNDGHKKIIVATQQDIEELEKKQQEGENEN